MNNSLVDNSMSLLRSSITLMRVPWLVSYSQCRTKPERQTGIWWTQDRQMASCIRKTPCHLRRDCKKYRHIFPIPFLALHDMTQPRADLSISAIIIMQTILAAHQYIDLTLAFVGCRSPMNPFCCDCWWRTQNVLACVYTSSVFTVHKLWLHNNSEFSHFTGPMTVQTLKLTDVFNYTLISS